MKTRIVQKQFKRKETKYIVDKKTFELLEKELRQYMMADEFATSTITNIYFDNEDFDMIQDSLAKKNGREKIRMRVYDATPSESSQAFLEIKKKENKIGYKYRLTSNPVSVANYIENGVIDSTIKDDKVTSELEMLRERYGTIKPKMYIYYDRVSYKGIEDKKVRLTIDKNLLYRDYDVDAMEGKFGTSCKQADLISLKYKKKKEALILEYQVLLDKKITDKHLVDTVLSAGPLDVVLNKQMPKKKYL
ncbi:polyphosphate polymerase domain-containing protein [Streptococcus suis]|uniref:Spx family transcriptional regulator n=1 Tax=Streptococcus suis TaxID=1307 RepID=A0A116MYZ0_STRSU|nr:polyphosphate polymerase domain-containing protein [Streptococcus suis]MDY7603307.1 polyphosphate polymerase domain-containing protein [Streptococcus suis]NQG71404.1 polyphosphate polymerase domain-containing protein [Streptococcus suis]NQN45360.1 polyphosphate polymerase domain-containing protein [Streptococcus suis]NQP04471.1 polyphosphate polymerase domain-containing protein [Streptococcus suis]CYV74211.1 Spx family transcriptional regulator [Streptococcus suis]